MLVIMPMPSPKKYSRTFWICFPKFYIFWS